MLKILPAAQIKGLDASTIASKSISSSELMERACRAFATWFTDRFDIQSIVGIVCGTGNNGGDGLGISRLLQELGYQVTVWVVRGTVSESADFLVNFELAKRNKIEIVEVDSEPDPLLFDHCDVLIDALFGSGLTRPVTGIYADVIRTMNTGQMKRVAVDLPSGLMADSPSVEPIVKADYSVSFQLPKLAFFQPQCHPFVGQWSLVDIGLSKEYIREADVLHFYITKKDARRVVKRRSTFDHKGIYGHALLVAGSFGKMGAAVLASRGTLRAGVGLLTTHIPRCGYSILQVAVPEAMASVDDHESSISEIGQLEKYTVIGIGPGIGTLAETVEAFASVLRDFNKPMVIDADGLNILSSNRALLHLIPEGSILTPHPKEFERMVGPWQDDFEKLEKQRQLAVDLKSVIVLKGAYSSIASPDRRIFFNSTGNPGMATGGTGDVLTGILTGLLAQGYTPLEAALLGVYLHGLSGDLAVIELGMTSLNASDIVDFLPNAFLALQG